MKERIKFVLLAVAITVSTSIVSAIENKDTLKINFSNNSEIKIIFEDTTALKSIIEEINEAFSDILNEEEFLNDDTEQFDYSDYDYEIVEGVEEYDYYSGYNENDFEKYWKKYKTKHNKRKVSHDFYFGLGLNNYLENEAFPSDNNAQYSVKPFSWNVNIGGITKFRLCRHFGLYFDYIFSWYNFKFQDNATRLEKTQFETLFYSDQRNGIYKKSKLSVPYFNIGFTPTIYSKNFRIGAGMYGGYRLGGKTKQKYEIDNKRYNDKVKSDFFLNSYHYGIKAIIGFTDLTIYATYDLNSLFVKDKGPELNVISLGICFGF